MLCSVLLGLLFTITTSLGARILGIVLTPSYRHQIVFRPLWRELLLRGHQVTVMTTDPMNDTSLTNITEIDIQFSYKIWNEKVNMVEMANLNFVSFLNYIVGVGGYLSSEQLQYFGVQNCLKNTTENYDLVLTETFFPVMVTFAEKFKCPFILGHLGHPNIKLFITQGGLQSLEEAICNHIPIIGMPFIVDQQFNVQKIENEGAGVSLDFTTIDKKAFKETILEVINNPTYRNRVKELAKLVSDQPMKSTELAVWWTEYTTRHKRTTYLESPALALPDYQYYLLDVVGFCVVVVAAVGYVLVQFGKVIFR